jgi:hypothetical protein
VIEGAILIVFLVPAAFIAWSSVRVLTAPEKGWAAGRSRWMVFGSRKKGEPRPERRELRFWAAVWLSIAAAILALGVALALVQ